MKELLKPRLRWQLEPHTLAPTGAFSVALNVDLKAVSTHPVPPPGTVTYETCKRPDGVAIVVRFLEYRRDVRNERFPGTLVQMCEDVRLARTEQWFVDKTALFRQAIQDEDFPFEAETLGAAAVDRVGMPLPWATDMKAASSRMSRWRTRRKTMAMKACVLLDHQRERLAGERPGAF